MQRQPLVDHQGNPVRLIRELGRGGEGVVYETDSPKRVAKLYLHPLDHQKADKLQAMASLASDSILRIAAWPLEVLRDERTGQVQGFLMPRITSHKPVHLLYGVHSRRNEFPAATWQHLAHAAMNAAAAFEELHGHGHVIGDVNENNVLVSPQDYRVSLIDCDSFQVTSRGRVFRCEVGVPLFTPPELQGKPLKDVERTLNHDRFGLAVLLFQLLFLGRHPFFGRFSGHGEMPPEKAIREWRFAFGRGAAGFQMQPPPFSLPLAFLPTSLAEAFEQAFARNAQRPTAEAWRTGLKSLLASVATCPRDSSHKYPTSQGRCPWCAFEAQGVSFFVAFQVAGGSLVFVCRPAELDDLLAQLGSVGVDRTEPPQPTGLAVSPRALPAGFDAMARRARQFGALARGGFILTAVGIWLVVLGLSGVGWPIAIASLIVWLVSQGASSSASRNSLLSDTVNARRSALAAASNELSSARRRWGELGANLDRAEHEARQRVDAIRREFAGLQQEYDAEKRKLSDDRFASQKNAFLRSKYIANYEIKGIKAGRKAALRSYQFETALDVLTRNVEQVPGFGPKLKSALRSWAQGLESTFKFDPSKGVSESEVRLLVTRYQQRKAARRAEAQAIVSELHRLATATGGELNQLRAAILRGEHERAQADVAVTALDGLVSRPSPGFWWSGTGAIAAGLIVLGMQLTPGTSVSVPEAPPVAAPVPGPPPTPVAPTPFPTAIPIPRSCTVRAEPSPGSAAISGVKLGTTVSIGESINGWRRIQLSSGAEGWTGPKCWLPTEESGGSCREDGDCRSESCVDNVCR